MAAGGLTVVAPLLSDGLGLAGGVVFVIGMTLVGGVVAVTGVVTPPGRGVGVTTAAVLAKLPNV